MMYGRFRADPYESYMALSLHWGVLFMGVLVIRARLFGVDIIAPDFWKLPCLTCGHWHR